MVEKVLFEIEKEMNGAEIAGKLRAIAEKIESGEPITLESESQKAELETDRPAEFEIKVEEENGEESLELEIEWKRNRQESNEGLSIK